MDLIDVRLLTSLNRPFRMIYLISMNGWTLVFLGFKSSGVCTRAEFHTKGSLCHL